MIINKLYAYLYKLSVLKLLLFGIFLSLFIAGGMVALGIWISPKEDDVDFLRTINFRYFVKATIIAPLLETYIFQYLPLKIARYFFQENKYLYCITIVFFAGLFGLLHPNHFMFLFGLVLVLICFVLMRKKQHPFLYTALIHCVYNTVLVAIIFWIKYFYSI
jgi:hypothetical protein